MEVEKKRRKLLWMLLLGVMLALGISATSVFAADSCGCGSSSDATCGTSCGDSCGSSCGGETTKAASAEGTSSCDCGSGDGESCSCGSDCGDACGSECTTDGACGCSKEDGSGCASVETTNDQNAGADACSCGSGASGEECTAGCCGSAAMSIVSNPAMLKTISHSVVQTVVNAVIAGANTAAI